MNTKNVLIKPIVTEKSTAANTLGKYIFLVRKEANKIEVKKTIEKLYGVKVIDVNVINAKPKYRMGRGKHLIAKRLQFKKVIVSVKDKKVIDVNKFKEK